jgi:uncharacterized iron-regulated protein
MKYNKKGKLVVVMYQFSFEQQYMLDEYQLGKLSFKDLLKQYKQIGTEKHELKKYRPLLEFCKRNVGRIKLQSGFLPSPFAKEATSRIKFDKSLKEAK